MSNSEQKKDKAHSKGNNQDMAGSGIPAEKKSQDIVKHVAPYPIAIHLTKKDSALPPIAAQIVKLVDHGYLIKTSAGPMFKVSDEWGAQFEFPVVHSRIDAPCVVVKTYDSFDGQNSTQQKLYVVEMHFRALTSEQKKSIEDYLVASGQKKRVKI